VEILLVHGYLKGNSNISVIETDNLRHYDFAYRNHKVLELGITAAPTGKSYQIQLFWNVDKDKAIYWLVIIESEDLYSVCKESCAR
jgi:hypothetical protein